MQTGRHTKRDKKMSRAGLICLLLLVAAVLLFAGITTARYVMEWSSGTTQADAKDFYFISDLLTSGDTPVYQLSDFVPGTSTITFTLRNYADSLRVSEANIDYTITTDNASVTHSGGTITKSDTTGVDETVTISVPTAAFTNGTATIRVTATSTSPYSQSLAAVFELYQRLDDITVTVHDAAGSNTLTLLVTTNDEGGTVSLSIPANVLPDSTDNRLTISGSTCSFNAVANAQYSFTFFKTAPTNTYTYDYANGSHSIVSTS